MKVRKLIDLLGESDIDADVYVQVDSRSFAPAVWLGILDTAGLFDEEKDLQLVISPWQPEATAGPSDEQ
jgi:hypothetical protein